MNIRYLRSNNIVDTKHREYKWYLSHCDNKTMITTGNYMYSESLFQRTLPIKVHLPEIGELNENF